MKLTKELTKLLSQLETLKDDITSEYLTMSDDRQCVYDDRSEKWQESDRGQEYEENTDELLQYGNDAETAIEEAIEAIRNIENI